MTMLTGIGSRLVFVLAFVLALLAVTGCGGGEGAAKTFAPDPDARLVTVNIDVTDAGFEPASVRVPAGPNVQLILRNRSGSERHYRVLGLKPTEPLWLAQPEDMEREEGVTDEDHEQHHEKGFVAFRGTSTAGVKPTLSEVHLYVIGGGVDVMQFYALEVGTYEVEDPLHPEVRGRFTVYEP